MNDTKISDFGNSNQYIIFNTSNNQTIPQAKQKLRYIPSGRSPTRRWTENHGARRETYGRMEKMKLKGGGDGCVVVEGGGGRSEKKMNCKLQKVLLQKMPSSGKG